MLMPLDQHSTPYGWLLTDPDAEAGAIETLPPTPGLQQWTRRQIAEAIGTPFLPAAKVSVTSESLLDLATLLLPDVASRQAVVRLKDKLACRQLLLPLFPGIVAQTVPLHTLPAFPFDPGQSYVVKPVKGCFGSGVRVVTPGADLHGFVAEIAAEVERHRAVLSDGVLSADTLIVEPYIEGEEYAVDMFYDGVGRPIITGIYHHPMPRNPAYLHLLYATSRELFAQFYDPLVRFFTAFNRLLGVRSFPIHAEFRLRNGELVPIEFNPLRFGGMGLANLGYHTLGVNAYRHFLDDTSPDWQHIWETAPPSVYAFIIAYNGRRAELQTQRPDWPALQRRFSHIHHAVPFDYQRQLAFGVLYVEEPRERVAELLRLEFDDFFVPITEMHGLPA